MRKKLKFEKYEQDRKGRGEKVAFTLAETLITLVIIGIVSAITVPSVMNNINAKQKEEKVKNVYHKLSRSADKMLGVSGMNGYANTEEFLNAFKNHLSISKICKPENIQECWGSKEVTLTDGTKWDVSKTKTTKTLQIPKDEKYSGYKDIMGFIMNDGTPFIVSYDTNCDLTISQGKVWDKSGQSTSTNCISGVFDYNGGKKPNKLTDDVKNFTASAGIGPDCAFKVNGKCFLAPQPVTAVSKSECEAMIKTHGIQGCNYETDYWAGAVKMCGGVNKMATKDDLKQIASEIYDMPINDSVWTYCNGKDNTQTCFTSANSVAQKYQITPGQWFWSAEEYGSSNAYDRNFYGFGSSSSYSIRYGSGGRVLCRGD